MDSRISQILWHNSVIGLARVSLEGRWLEVNQVFSDTLEYTQSELEALTFRDVTHPEDLPDQTEMIKRVIERQLPYYIMTKRYITKSNKVIWMKLRVDPVLSNDNKVEAFISQLTPASYVSSPIVCPTSGEVTKDNTAFKKSIKWIVTFIGGLGLSIFGMLYDDTNIKHLGELVILGALAGQTIDKSNVKSSDLNKL